MKVEEVKSDGIGYHTPAMNSVSGTLSTVVSLFKMRFTEDEIFSKLPKDYDYYPGNRYNDNDTIVTRICSALTGSALKSLTGESRANDITNVKIAILEGMIKSFVDSLSGSEMDVIVLDAIRDCASSDHWYKFEKEWN